VEVLSLGDSRVYGDVRTSVGVSCALSRFDV
jgi:hypothetical protein